MPRPEPSIDNLSHRDTQHLAYVPDNLDFLPLGDKLTIGRSLRMEDVIQQIAVEIVDEQLAQVPSREFTQQEVLAIVSWTA